MDEEKYVEPHNTKVHLRESPFEEDALLLDVHHVVEGVQFISFHCTNSEVLTVPYANIMLIEQVTDGYYDDESEDEDE